MATLSFAEQSARMQSMRPETAHIEFVFNDGDKEHPLFELLAHHDPERTIGAGPGNGYYGRGRPNVVKRTHAYNCDIIRAIESLVFFFPGPEDKRQWTELGG